MNTINIQGQLLSLKHPIVMGILNLTPDSFYEQSRVANKNFLLKRAESMLANGAEILDLGAYSTRPGAEAISEEEELNRMLPAVEALKKEFPSVILSIDTFRASVAKATVDLGAGIINDVSGGTLDEKMFSTVAKLKAPYVLMHMKGTPQTMSNYTDYDNLNVDILNYFIEKITELRALGVQDILIDLGFGFAKTREQNFELLNAMQSFQILDCPMLLGISRKSMITKTLNIEAKDALNGTTALNMVALMNGAKILRVHDVKEARECVQLFKALKNSED